MDSKNNIYWLISKLFELLSGRPINLVQGDKNLLGNFQSNSRLFRVCIKTSTVLIRRANKSTFIHLKAPLIIEMKNNIVWNIMKAIIYISEHIYKMKEMKRNISENLIFSRQNKVCTHFLSKFISWLWGLTSKLIFLVTSYQEPKNIILQKYIFLKNLKESISHQER